MSFPMFVLSIREIPKAKVMSEVLFTTTDTLGIYIYIGKQPSKGILYYFGWILVEFLIKI